MFKHVIKAKYIKDYKIWLSFNDGLEGEVNLAEKITKSTGIFKPLSDISFFKKFKITNDTLSWENGADLAPDFLYNLVNN